MKKAFTLLELVVVIIIVGVLTALALPKLFSVIEGARATEALTAIASLRTSIERCYLMSDKSYTNCQLRPEISLNELDMEDPSDSPNSHFNYQVMAWNQSYSIHIRRKGVAGEPYYGHAIVMGFGCVAAVISETNTMCSFTFDDKFYWAAATVYKPFIPKNN